MASFNSLIMLGVLCVMLLSTQIYAQGSRAGHCPVSTAIKQCQPRCTADWECSGNRKCCDNACGSKSCIQDTVVGYGGVGGGSGGHGADKYSAKGPGGSLYCGNVKCRAGQKCIMDRATSRPACGP